MFPALGFDIAEEGLNYSESNLRVMEFLERNAPVCSPIEDFTSGGGSELL